jgi:ferric-chelate reductase [NAD(P)H]
MPDNILQKITYGMYIVSSVRDGRFNGQVVNTVFQTTDVPPMIAVCINRQNLTHEFISASGRLSVSILAEEAPMTFLGTFGFKSGRAIDKFKAVQFRVLDSGCPVVLEYALGYIEAVVKNQQENGRHTLFTCEVTGSEIISAGTPMTYEYYHRVKKGLTPQSAPTFAARIPDKT